jgi:hypothetical protein
MRAVGRNPCLAHCAPSRFATRWHDDHGGNDDDGHDGDNDNDDNDNDDNDNDDNDNNHDKKWSVPT